MLSVPSDVLRDVLLPLDRWTLDDVKFTNRRFLRLILDRMSDVCLRRIHRAAFRAPKENENQDGSSYMISVDTSGSRWIRSQHEDTALLFSEFVQALRSSRVGSLAFDQLVFTPALATLLLEAPIVVCQLDIFGGSCAELSPSQFHEVLLHFSPSWMWLGCHLRACHLSDEFVRTLFKGRLRRASFLNVVSVDGGSFGVTDDAIVDLCMQPDAQTCQEGDEPSIDLVLSNGSFTQDLFKRLLEASDVSTRTQLLRIAVSAIQFEDEDLHDFAEHLSYLYRGTPYQQRIYDFPGEKHGEVPAMHLQIALQSNHLLEVVRGRRPGPFFRESDE